ncbi:hypothetical protein [Candidatus Electrothrix sp.]|uniref:hypothetical protein n=1 Tax=Candidatus Electrothrix sp. TaxID=2170559 RepID=UPI0040573D48
MKKLHITIFWASLISLFFLFSTSTVYAEECAKAIIKKVGVSPTETVDATPYLVRLDCEDQDEAWSGVIPFYIGTDLGDSGLATLLTSYSLGKSLWVEVGGITPGSLVTVLFVNE